MKTGASGILTMALLIAVVFFYVGHGGAWAEEGGGETVTEEVGKTAVPEAAENPETTPVAETDEAGESAGGTAAPAVRPNPPSPAEEEEIISRPQPSAEQTRYRDKYVSGMKIAFLALNIILLVLAAALIWRKKRKG